MASTQIKLILLLGLMLLTACASRPLQYPNVVPPQAIPFERMQSDKPIVALVLGSGGERGFAHVGVIKALEENGIRADLVVGTSAGSVVGALYAGGFNSEQLEQLALALDREKLNDFELSKRGYLRGDQLQDFINRALHNRSIEQLQIPFIAVATQLSSGNAIAFNRGNTGLAARASSSIPGVFIPATIEGLEYVDGDLKKPVAVSVAREMGADVVIAVDISEQPKDHKTLEDVIDTLNQSIRIMRQSILSCEMESAQIVIRPLIGITPDTDLAGKSKMIQQGEEAAKMALPKIRELLKKSEKEKQGDRIGNLDWDAKHAALRCNT